MKGLSIRLKITLWYSAALLTVVVLTFAIIIAVGNGIIQKTVRDGLIQTVTDNIDEIEFIQSAEELESRNDVDHYLEYRSGFLEIDDDFLDSVNQIYTSLCTADGSLVYGENPIVGYTNSIPFSDSTVQNVKVNKTTYYVFDKRLVTEGLEMLWLRGIVSSEQGTAQTVRVMNTSAFVLPLLVIISIIGGYLLSKRLLRPIQQISSAAAEIHQGGDLEKRIDIGKGNDELHRLADSFNLMFERLDNSFKAEKQFASDASHELRTPMAVIMSQCELSLEKEQTPDEYKEALQVISRQGRKMTRLVNAMLEFTRIETRSDRYVIEKIDLSSFVESLCKDMAIIAEKEIELSCDIQEGIVFYGNRELFARMVTNLVSNAYRYGKDNGHIRVSLRHIKNSIVLSVKDDGIGIAEEDMQRIFRRFYQCDASRNSNSTGIGLSMVEEIVKFHSGRIEVKSVLGEGSEFVCTFPKY